MYERDLTEQTFSKMDRHRIERDVLDLLNRLHKGYPNKTPCVFGQGFEKSGFKVYDVNKEMVIPDAICINSYVLNVLSDYKTVFHIDNYMKTSDRSAVVGQDVSRTAAMILMLSCVGYSFNVDTFPFCNNSVTNQMWADIEQMIKGDHVCCTLLAVATRGRSHEGFTKQHAARCSVPPVSILDVPTFKSFGAIGDKRHTEAPRQLPVQRPPPPPPPQQPNLPTSENVKSFVSAVKDKST